MFRWRTYCLVLCLLLLGACSGTSFVYNRLDFLIPWYVNNDFVELNGQQEIFLDEELAPFLEWHRKQELPAYSGIVQDIETRLDAPMTPEGVSEVFKAFEAAWLRVEDKSLDWLLALGGQLSDEQMEDFVQALWEQQEEYEEEYLERSDEEFYEDSLDNFLDNGEEYLGRLSDEQREQLRLAVERLERSDAVWLTERAAWLKQLETLLQREYGWEAEVKAAVAAQRDNLSTEYLRILEHNMGVIYQAVADLVNSRSEKQDKHLRERLAEILEDLEELANEE